LELIPAEVLGTDAFTGALQGYCGVLHAEGCFAGLSWHDARHVAAAISLDVCCRDDAAQVLRDRSVIDQQVLPTAVGHAEPIAAQMNFADARVTHVDSAVADQYPRCRRVQYV